MSRLSFQVQSFCIRAAPVVMVNRQPQIADRRSQLLNVARPCDGYRSLMASLAINARAARIGHGQGVHVKCLPQPLRHGVLGVNSAVAATLLATKVLARCIIICNLYAGWDLGLGTASRATATELPRSGQVKGQMPIFSLH